MATIEITDFIEVLDKGKGKTYGKATYVAFYIGNKKPVADYGSQISIWPKGKQDIIIQIMQALMANSKPKNSADLKELYNVAVVLIKGLNKQSVNTVIKAIEKIGGVKSNSVSILNRKIPYGTFLDYELKSTGPTFKEVPASSIKEDITLKYKDAKLCENNEQDNSNKYIKEALKQQRKSQSKKEQIN